MNRNTTIQTIDLQGYAVSFKGINERIKKVGTLVLIYASILLSALQTKAQSGFSGPISGSTTEYTDTDPTSSYSVDGAGDGTTFSWSISTSGAGSISSNGSTATVTCNTSNSGSVNVNYNPVYNGNQSVGANLLARLIAGSQLVSGSLNGNQSIDYNTMI